MITELVAELGIPRVGSRPARQARVLYCLGLRAELAARPTRAEAYRQVADELALMQSVEPDHRHAAGLYSAE
ncbi:hypothetical protein KBZ21_41985, partial [Streptomyces sp. A73]|nr:hypothetical protein [Streptomyces sp. A73]